MDWVASELGPILFKVTESHRRMDTSMAHKDAARATSSHAHHSDAV